MNTNGTPNEKAASPHTHASIACIQSWILEVHEFLTASIIDLRSHEHMHTSMPLPQWFWNMTNAFYRTLMGSVKMFDLAAHISAVAALLGLPGCENLYHQLGPLRWLTHQMGPFAIQVHAVMDTLSDASGTPTSANALTSMLSPASPSVVSWWKQRVHTFVNDYVSAAKHFRPAIQDTLSQPSPHAHQWYLWADGVSMIVYDCNRQEAIQRVRKAYPKASTIRLSMHIVKGTVHWMALWDMQ